MGYEERDWEIVDYGVEMTPDHRFKLRGPLPDLDGADYFSTVGAAQTFGCFCQKPYPMLLQEQLALPVLNLGVGGAGPEFFNNNPILIDYINRSRFVVVQVMSGRSQSKWRVKRSSSTSA